MGALRRWERKAFEQGTGETLSPGPGCRVPLGWWIRWKLGAYSASRPRPACSSDIDVNLPEMASEDGCKEEHDGKNKRLYSMARDVGRWTITSDFLWWRHNFKPERCGGEWVNCFIEWMRRSLRFRLTPLSFNTWGNRVPEHLRELVQDHVVSCGKSKSYNLGPCFLGQIAPLYTHIRTHFPHIFTSTCRHMSTLY